MTRVIEKVNAKKVKVTWGELAWILYKIKYCSDDYDGNQDLVDRAASLINKLNKLRCNGCSIKLKPMRGFIEDIGTNQFLGGISSC